MKPDVGSSEEEVRCALTARGHGAFHWALNHQISNAISSTSISPLKQ